MFDLGALGATMCVQDDVEIVLELWRGEHGTLELFVFDMGVLREVIDLDKNPELHDIWDWGLMAFNDAVVDEFVAAAVDVYKPNFAA